MSSKTYATPRTHYFVCEYWGSASRLAHSYTNYTSGGIQDTWHMHWSSTPGYGPYESHTLGHYGFYPVACASSESLTDNDMLLVSRAVTDDGRVWWSMETEN
jgi:hypothetical protein